MPKGSLKSAAIVLCLLLVGVVFAAETNVGTKHGTDAISVPQLINFQGKLTDGSGGLLTGEYDLYLEIYDVATGGTRLWSETQPDVQVTDGLFNVLLGSINPITSIPDGPDCYLQVTVETQVITPRMQMVSAPYTYNADDAANLGGVPAADHITISTTASGDLTGLYPGPTIARKGATDGQVLKWNSGTSSWQPANDQTGGTGTVTQINEGTGIDLTPNQITTTGTVAFDQAWGDNRYIPKTQAFSGDVTGTYNNTHVVRLQGRNVSSNAPGSNQVLTWYSNAWTPRTPSTGGVGGSGTADYVARWTGPTTLSNSSIRDNGSNAVSVGVAPNPNYRIYGYYDANCYGYLGSASYGVYGYGGASGTKMGVYGRAGNYVGVCGNHNIGLAPLCGVYGFCISSGSYGRLGTYNTGVQGNGTKYGVYGSSSTYSVYGYYSSNSYGYLGSASYGVYGYATNAAGYGVYGRNVSGAGATGIRGSGMTYGVYGSSGGYGVRGDGGTYGVYGHGTNIMGATGVYGSGETGVYGRGTAYGVYGHVSVAARQAGYFYNSGNGCYTYLCRTDGGTVYGVYTSGWGHFAAGHSFGGLSEGTVPTRDFGTRALYTMQSPEVWYEDFGSTQLKDGRVHVELDPVFLQTVTVDAENPMKVYVTQTSGNPVLVVVEKGLSGFDIIGPAGSDAGFDYRVAVKRAGYESKRLEVLSSE